MHTATPRLQSFAKDVIYLNQGTGKEELPIQVLFVTTVTPTPAQCDIMMYTLTVFMCLLQ